MVNHIKMTCSRQNENAHEDRYFDDKGSSCIEKMKMFPSRNTIIVMLGMPFILKPASNEIISDSAPLRDTSMKWGRMFVVRIHIPLHLTLIAVTRKSPAENAS